MISVQGDATGQFTIAKMGTPLFIGKPMSPQSPCHASDLFEGNISLQRLPFCHLNLDFPTPTPASFGRFETRYTL